MSASPGATRQPGDRTQNQYEKHNAQVRCGCASCVALRRDWPGVAATIDGHTETARRRRQYRVEEDYS